MVFFPSLFNSYLEKQKHSRVKKDCGNLSLSLSLSPSLSISLVHAILNGLYLSSPYQILISADRWRIVLLLQSSRTRNVTREVGEEEALSFSLSLSTSYSLIRDDLVLTASLWKFRFLGGGVYEEKNKNCRRKDIIKWEIWVVAHSLISGLVSRFFNHCFQFCVLYWEFDLTGRRRRLDTPKKIKGKMYLKKITSNLFWLRRDIWQ